MLGTASVSPAGFIDGVREQAAAAALIDRLRVRTASGAVPITSLSGGNQQKALLGRCLFAAPSVLLLDEPTRGIDLGAKAEIYELVRDLAARGFGIIVCSSELPEILMLCHRVLVFREGRVTAVMDGRRASTSSSCSRARARWWKSRACPVHRRRGIAATASAR